MRTSASGTCSEIALLLLILVLVGCGGPAVDPDQEATLRALEKTLGWLAAHPSDPVRAPLGELGMDIWTWNLFSRLHPDPQTRSRATQEVRERLKRLEPEVEPTLTSVSWWALLLRNLESQSLDTTPYVSALEEIDVARVLEGKNATTSLWTTELLRHSGLSLKSDFTSTYLATIPPTLDYAPTAADGMRLYHEIASVTDLGREPLHGFTDEQMRLARGLLPEMLRVCLAQQNTDAAAEVLIAAAILDERAQPFYRGGIRWLIAQQREGGDYSSARHRVMPNRPVESRHAVLVVSWALLESLQ